MFFYNNNEKVSYYELPIIKKIILKAKIFVVNSINKKQETINNNIENRKRKIDEFKSKYYSHVVNEGDI